MVLATQHARRRCELPAGRTMRRNVWTMLGVFLFIFGLAWFLNRSKTWAISRDLPDRGLPVQAEGDARTDARPATGQPSGSAEPTEGSKAMPLTESDGIEQASANRMAFAGAARFQLYRQGDITWRLDMETGRTCVLLATDEQWKLERVFSHGCGMD